jgi:hypothetical protein
MHCHGNLELRVVKIVYFDLVIYKFSILKYVSLRHQ